MTDIEDIPPRLQQPREKPSGRVRRVYRKQYPAPYDDAPERDNYAAIFAEMTRLADRIAVIGQPVGSWGDDQGGMIMKVLAKALERVGIRSTPPPRVPDGRTRLPSGSSDGHKRMHRIVKAHGGGWTCCYCAVDLIDVCDPANSESDQWGRLILLPGIDKVAATVEHLIPRSAGGSNEIGNLRLACMPCNLRKGSR